MALKFFLTKYAIRLSLLQLIRINLLLDKQIATLKKRTNIPLANSELFIMLLADLGNTLTLSELKALTELNEAYLSRLISKLEAAGMMLAKFEGRDKRKKTLYLSPKGSKAIAPLRSALTKKVFLAQKTMENQHIEGFHLYAKQLNLEK